MAAMQIRGHYFRILLAIVLAYVSWVFLGRYMSDRRWLHRHDREQEAANKAFESTYGGTAVKILQFYARDAVLTEGDKTVICYGVLNAKAVRISPAVDGVGPSLNRCIGVAPERNTRYTLTADGNDGRSVSASFDLSVVPDPATLPKITYFRIAERKRDYLGRALFILAYADQNAEEISIDPPVFSPMHRSPLGRFYVKPERTTTYTLTATGKHGHVARRELTVEVPEHK